MKYVITSSPAQLPGFQPIYQSDKEYIYLNSLALPRAYFVNKVENKKDIDVLNGIKANSFDPKNVAYLNDEKVKVDLPDSTTFVHFAGYKDEKVSIDVNASGNNFLFLGNTYMTKGMNIKIGSSQLFSSELWKAYIDGNKSKIYKVNHGFMGIVVPKGTHKVEFIFNPTSFVVSKYVALILSSLTVLGLVITLLIPVIKKKGKQNELSPN